MQQIKLIILSICALGAVSAQAGVITTPGATSAQADVITWDVSGVRVDGSGAGSYSADLVAGSGQVTGIDFDFGWEALLESFTQELVVQLVAPTGETFCAGTAGASSSVSGNYCFDIFGTALNFDLGGAASPGQILFSGTSSLLNGVASAGTWTLNMLDGFDDPGDDGFVFNTGSVSVSYATAAVPEPGTLALLGIGLFGMGLAKRRKAA